VIANERLVEIWNLNCRPHGHRSRTFVIAGDAYGQLLGRTTSKEIAEFNSWEDPAFDEALGLTRHLCPQTEKTGAPFQDVLGFVCDLSPGGRRYSFAGEIHCPECGTTEVEYGPDEPPEIRPMEVPQVSHRSWDNLTTSQKNQLLKEALIEKGWMEKS